MIAEDNAPEIHSRFKNIYQLVEKHFADEEEILLSSRYPEAEAHMARHKELLQKCAELLRKDAENTVSSAQMLQCIIHDLVLNHMVKEDGKYFAFLKAVVDPAH